MSYEFGDVALVPFPFSDQITSKKRRAVIDGAEPAPMSKMMSLPGVSGVWTFGWQNGGPEAHIRR